MPEGLGFLELQGVCRGQFVVPVCQHLLMSAKVAHRPGLRSTALLVCLQLVGGKCCCGGLKSGVPGTPRRFGGKQASSLRLLCGCALNSTGHRLHCALHRRRSYA